ncbi:MAG: tetratricopeptide repeat protein [Bradymonadaceae bacterium]|nr:tetratricopeptide repeat protein [Lujinxingiaceae bacterium]
MKANPFDHEAFGALAARFESGGDWRSMYQLYLERNEAGAEDVDFKALAEKLSSVAQALADGKDKANLLVMLGDLYVDYADERDAGMKAYQTAYKIYPDDNTSLERARQIYRKSGNFDRVLLLYTLELNRMSEPAGRAGVLSRMAQVKGDDCSDFDGAIELIGEACKLAPDDEFIEQLGEIYSSEETVRQRISQAAHRATRLVEQGGDRDEAGVLFLQAAQLEYDREGSEREKALLYARSAYEQSPEDSDVMMVMSELYRELGRLDELRAIQLERHGDAVSMVAPVNIVEHVEAIAEAEPAVEQQDEPTSNIDLAAEAHEDLQRPAHFEGAVTMILPAIRAQQAPDDTAAPPESEPDSEPDSKPELQSKAAAPEAAIVRPVVSTPTPTTSASITEVGAARELLSKDGTNLAALAVVRDALRAMGDIEGLIAQLEDSVRHLRKKDGELEVMLELANILWHELGEMERAEYYFKRVKLLDGEHEDVYAFYEDFYQIQGEWRKLFALLSGRQNKHAGVDEQRALATRLAEIAENELDSPEKAIDVWKGFLRDHDGDLHARQSLRQLYEASQKWNSLVDFYKDELRHLEAGGEATRQERVTILEDMAQIYREHMNLDTMVINVLGQILALEPAHPTAFYQLRELLESNRRFNDLAALLATAGESACQKGDLVSTVEYLTEVADIWQERLNNVTQALPFLERLVELVPDHAPTRERLRGVYESRRDYRSLFDLQLGDAQFLEGDALIAHLRQLVDLAQDRLRDPERAVVVLSRLLEHTPDDRPIIEKLEVVHRRQEDWANLASVLEKKADIAEGDDARLACLSEAAEIYEARLDALDKAATLWAQVLRLDPADSAALGRLTAIHVRAQRYDELDALYRTQGKFEQLYDIFDAAASTTDDLELRAALYRRMAIVAEKDIFDTDRIIISLETLREISAQPVEVVNELIIWYRAVGEIAREIEMNRVLLEHAAGAEARYTQIVRLAELEAEREDVRAALSWQLKAVALRPEERATVQRAEDLARQADELVMFVREIEDVAEILDDEATQDMLWERVSRLQWRELAAYEDAIKGFERLRDRHPTDLEFLEILENLFELAHAPLRRIEVLRAQMSLLTERGATQGDLVDQLSKIADVQRTHLGERDAARETYAEILDLEPDHLPSLRGTKELYREDQRWPEVVDCLLRELSLTTIDSLEARVGVEIELAGVYREHLDDLAEALRYYGQVLTEAPDHEAALTEVEALLSEPALARDAALLLEPIFRDLDRPNPLVRALEARLAVCDDRFEEQEILDELIPLYSERLEDRAAAFDRACRQFDLDAERDDIWLRVEQLGASLNQWARIEALFSRHSPLEGFESPVRYDLLRHLAAIREHRLGKKDEALIAWERLHEYDPLDLATLEALERLYRKMERSQDLSAVLLSRADLVDHDDERIKLLLEAAQINDGILDDVATTIDIYRNVLITDQEQPEAVTSLERLLRAQRSWHELDELLAVQADITLAPERRREFVLKLALLRFEQMSDYPGATALLQQLLENDPGDDDVIEVLQRVDAHLADDGNMPELRLEIAQILEPVYRFRGQYNQLILVLRVRLQFTDAPFDRIELLDQLAELFLEKADDVHSAFDALRAAVVLDPENESRIERVEDLAREIERVVDAVASFKEATLQADPLLSAAIWKRVGGLERDVLDDAAAAIEAFEAALDCVEADHEALVALEGLFEVGGDYARLAENLRLQGVYGDPSLRAELLRRIGTLEEMVLERVIEATDAYTELLELEPDDIETMEALERLYERQDRWIDVAELLNRKVGSMHEPDLQIETLLKLAEIHETRLHNADDAIRVYNQVLSIDAGHDLALAALDRLFEAEARWAELADVLRAKMAAPSFEATELRNSLELRLAHLQLKELYAPEDAVDLYRAVLGRSPGQVEAIEALESLLRDPAWSEEVARDLVPHYRDSEQWDRLVALYDSQREQSHDPETKARFLFESAQIHRTHLADEPAAIEALAKAWKLDWEHDPYRAELVAVAANSQAWGALAEAIEDVLTVVSDPDRMLDLRMQLAHLYRDELEDSLEAETNLREALTLDERHGLAYAELETILLEAERWHDLVELLERRFGALGDSDVVSARETLLRIAQVQEEQLSDSFTAAETYQRVLGIEPQDGIASASLNRLLRAQERWQDLATHLEEQLQRSSDHSAVIDLKIELAQVYCDPLMEFGRALELYREILDLDGTHGQAIAALESIFAAEADLRGEVGAVLEPVYRRGGDWPRIIEVLEVRAGEQEDPIAQLSILREIAQIAEDALDDTKLALATWGRVFAADPQDASARAALQRLTSLSRNWSVLCDLYATSLRENFSIGDDLRAELLADQAQVFEERLVQLDDARRGYEEVLLLEPGHEAAIDALERIFMRSRDWAGLADFYGQRVESELDDTRARAWLERLSVLHEDVLGDTDAAIDVHMRIIELAPGDRLTQQTLVRLFSYAKRWQDLAELYRQRAAYAVDPNQVIELRFALARLLQDELEQLDEALDLYRDILAIEPGYFGAMRGLEGLRRDLGSKEGDWTAYRIQVIEILLAQYDEGRHWQRMVDLLEEKAELVVEVGVKVNVLVEVAELLSRVSEDIVERTQALTLLARAFCLDPSNQDLSEFVGTLADEIGAWERIVPIYLSGVENTDDAEIQSTILLAIARIYEGPLEDQESSITAYQQAIELAPENESAVARLQELYGELGLWKPLVAVLERRLDAVFDDSGRQRLLKRIASLYDETLHQPQDAARIYRQLREIDRSELAYIVVLERLYEQCEDHASLEALLRDKLAMVEDEGIRLRTLKRLAVIQDEVLNYAEAAIESYSTILAKDENDVGAIRALSRLFEQTERWPELLDMLNIERDCAGSTDELNSVQCRMGYVLLDKLNAPYDALPHFAEVVQRDAFFNGARLGLIRLLESEQTRDAAALVLEEIYRAAREWEALELLLEQQLEAQTQPDRRSELFVGLAQLHEVHFEQVEKAFMTLGRAFREQPAATSVRRELERLAGVMGNHDELVATYEDAIDAGIDNLDVLRDVHWHLGVAYAEILGELGEAIRHMEAVLGFDEFDIDCLDWLDRLYQQERQWEKLAGVLEKKLVLSDPDKLNSVCYQLGYLREVVFEQPAEALELYRRVILDEPRHGGALEGLERLVEEVDYRYEIFGLLEPIYLETDAHAKLAQLYNLRLETVESSAERSDLNKKIATIEIDHLHNTDVGYAYLGRALREDPHDSEVQERLERLADEHELFEQIVALYEDVIVGLNDPVRIIELALKAAVWSVNALGDTERATELFRSVLELENDNELALNSLEQIARHNESYEGLADVLAKKAEVLFDPDLRRAVLMELAAICAHLERFEQAIEAYKQALMLDESDIDVMQALVGLYEVTEQYDHLVDILERLTLHLYEPATQLQLFMRIGRYSTVFLKQFDRALGAYERAQQLDAENRDVLLALEELYEASGQWDMLAEILTTQLGAAQGNDELVRLLVKQAGLKYEQYGDAQGAIDDYLRAFEYQNDHPLIVSALDRLYRREGRAEELLNLLKHQLGLVGDGDNARRVPLLVQIADVCQSQLGDDDTAIAYLSGVLEIDRLHDGALEVLAALYSRKGDWAQVMGIWERQFEAAGSNEVRISIMTKIASLLDQTLERSHDAAAYYLEILQIEALHAETLETLTALYMRLAAYEQIHELLEHRASHASNDDERVALYLEMGELARKHIADPGARINALEKARALRPDDLTVVEPLLDAYIAANHLDRAEPILSGIITSLIDARRIKEVVRFHHLQGKLAEQKGDSPGALESYDAAHKIDATYIPNLLSLGKLHFRMEDWDQALKAFQTLLLHQMNIKENSDKVDVYFHLGHVRKKLGDDRRAKDMFTRALSIDPHHEASRQALTAL